MNISGTYFWVKYAWDHTACFFYFSSCCLGKKRNKPKITWTEKSSQPLTHLCCLCVCITLYTFKIRSHLNRTAPGPKAVYCCAFFICFRKTERNLSKCKAWKEDWIGIKQWIERRHPHHQQNLKQWNKRKWKQKGRRPKKGKVLKVCYECNSVMVFLETKGSSRQACSSIITHCERVINGHR